uniref:Uncharacterized protein n=1 Tax=Anguilla anguilla TaxID=7936 RepID=A0A0E9UEM8_ANGAN
MLALSPCTVCACLE